MAQVELVLEIQTISQQHGYIKGWEKFQFKGETRNRLWTVWTKQIEVTEGDTVIVIGDLSTKAATYVPKNASEAKHIVEHSLNDVSIAKYSQVKVTQARTAIDILSQVPLETEELPF